MNKIRAIAFWKIEGFQLLHHHFNELFYLALTENHHSYTEIKMKA